MAFGALVLAASLQLSLGASLMAYYGFPQIDPAAFDWGTAMAEGREIGRSNRLRDLARGTDLLSPQGREQFRSQAYKIDPIMAERDYGSLLAGLDDAGRQKAAALREQAGRAFLRIKGANPALKQTLWNQARQQFPDVFDAEYSPEVERSTEYEFMEYDKALDAMRKDQERERAMSLLAGNRASLGMGPQPGSYRARLQQIESGGRDDAASPHSSAAGRYQFIGSTWADLGMDPAAINDPRAQEEALTRFLSRNAKQFQGWHGRAPNDAEQYAMHWFGPTNAKNLYRANPDTPIERIIGGGAAATNGIDGMTAGEVRAILQQRMGTGTSWQGGAAAPADAAPVQVASNQDFASMFAALPEWQQAAVLMSADPVSEAAKIFAENQKAREPKTTDIVTIAMPSGEVRSFDATTQQDAIRAALNGGGRQVPSGFGMEGARDQNAMFGQADKLRDEFTKLTQPFRETQFAYQKIQASATNPSAAGDMALIFGYMKLLDPGSTVREGEYATAEQARGVPGTIVNMYNRVLSGERLTPEQRADFLRQSELAFRPYQAAYSQAEASYKALAESYGIEPRNVLVPFVIPSSINEDEKSAIEGRWLTPPKQPLPPAPTMY